MSNILPFPNNDNKTSGSGSGPEDPMLEERVKALETGQAEMKAGLRAIQDSLLEIKTDLKSLPRGSEIGEIKGRIAAMPTTWQLLGLLLTTWAAGAAIVFAILRFGTK